MTANTHFRYILKQCTALVYVDRYSIYLHNRDFNCNVLRHVAINTVYSYIILVLILMYVLRHVFINAVYSYIILVLILMYLGMSSLMQSAAT